MNSFDRSVKSWQFLGMIHVISFNSTGVGVYNSTCTCIVSVARTNSEAVLNLVYNIFLTKTSWYHMGPSSPISIFCAWTLEWSL